MNENERLACFKSKLIETYKAFDDFCAKNNITYFAAFGTAIGAIRHKGIIPWDDDIDVFMDWDNYQRFLDLKPTLLGTGYDIISKKETGYPLTFAKFYNKNTTLLERIHMKNTYGVFIDVEPLGYVSDIETAREFQKRYAAISKSYAYSCQRFSFTLQDFKYVITHLTRVFKSFRKRIKAQYYKEELDRMDAQMANTHSGKYLLTYTSKDSFEKSLYDPAWFEKSIRMPFEDTEISVPVGYHEYLTTNFGDYMVPPPEKYQKVKHSFYYMNLKEGLTMEEVRKRIKRGETTVY